MPFPGNEKNQIEFFVHGLFEGDAGKQYSKEQICRDAEGFDFSSEDQKLFHELPDEQYDEQHLIDCLNDVLERHGRVEEIGGRLEKRDQIPAEWQEAYRGQYQPH